MPQAGRAGTPPFLFRGVSGKVRAIQDRASNVALACCGQQTGRWQIASLAIPAKGDS